MPPSATGKADYVIQEVAGCGPFQAIITFLVYFVGKSSSVFSMYFLLFSLYNPGWRCLDNHATNYTTTTSSSNTPVVRDVRFEQSLKEDRFLRNGSDRDKVYYSDGELVFNNCTLFYSCQNVQFDSTTSNLVSEWGLVCDKAWIGSLIASLQMVGLLLGSVIVGQLGDSIGRKTTIYGSQIFVAVLTLLSIFSTSWQMMAGLRFLVGIACSGNMSLVYVYVAEFVTLKWRARIVTIPYWSVTAIIFGVVLMALKDWRQILIVTLVLSVVGFVPVVWVPESLRWLEVKQKRHQFLSAARKITRVNGKTLPSMEVLTSGQNETSNNSSTEQQQPKQRPYMLFHLFKKGYRLQTLIVSFEWFSCSVWYYAINFGVRTLYGNFYINLMLVSVCEIPPDFIAMAMAKMFRRKTSKLIFLIVVIMSFIVVCCFNLSPVVALKTTGVAVVVMIAKAGASGYWTVLYTQTAELYPTVVRSLAINWGNLFARVGGAIAPFLLPNDPNSVYISYAAMAVLGLGVGLTAWRLRETKGRPLKQTFEDDDAYDGGVVVGVLKNNDDDVDDVDVVV